MPLLMTEDLLQDLVLYKKSHEKAVSAAARSLITWFREVCPSLLIKKDHGWPVDPKARPRAYGEVNVSSNVPGVELLEHDDDYGDSKDDGTDDSAFYGSDDDHNEENIAVEDDEENELSTGSVGSEEEDNEDDSGVDEDDDSNNSIDEDSGVSGDDLEDEEEEAEDVESEQAEEFEEGNDSPKIGDNDTGDGSAAANESKAEKRKYSDFDGQLIAADTSLQALKRLAEAEIGHASSTYFIDGILSNEDFQMIKELKAKKDAKVALAQQGFKIPSSDQLSVKRVDPAKLEAHVHYKLSKEERLALVRAGREDKGKYMS